jgi:hypothetical protein
LFYVMSRDNYHIKIRETKELACAHLLQIAVRHCARDHDQWLGLWMARLDVTEDRGKLRSKRKEPSLSIRHTSAVEYTRH